MRYRRRLLWMPMLAFLAVLAAGCAAEDTSAPEPTTAPTTTELDVAEPSEPEGVVFSEQECAEEIIGFEYDLGQMEATLAKVAASLDAGQLSQAESDYWHLSGLVTVAHDFHKSWHDYCDHVLPDRAAEVAALSEKVRQTWEQAEQKCRDRSSDLFHCE